MSDDKARPADSAPSHGGSAQNRPSKPARKALPGTTRPPPPAPSQPAPSVPAAEAGALAPASEPPAEAAGPASSPPPISEAAWEASAPDSKSEPPPEASFDSLMPESEPLPRIEEAEPHRKVGRCELFSEIGHGGMATVFLGRWVGAGGFAKTVAVKALHRQYARDVEFVKMFLDEARVVARIRHPNVMPTIDLVDEGGELFIVMDYVEGVTLAHLMRQMRKLGQLVPVEMSLRIITGVLHGLHAAHEAKTARGEPLCVIHRDVSPENILVGVDGYARLIDFGIASALGRHTDTQEGQVKGKTSYLTPEQVRGEPLGPHTDVFSAASVLWQALVGRRLFRAKNLAEITYKILNSQIEPPGAHRPELDKRYDRIVLRGLERTASKRWPTAQQMAEALEAAGGQASHRQVGDWVRKVAADRLERTAVLVEAVENAPMEATEGELERPLSIRNASRASIPDEATPPVEVWGISEDEESKTDVNAEAEVPRETAKRGSRWVVRGLGVVAVAVLAYGGIRAAGDDPVQPQPRPDKRPAPVAPIASGQPAASALPAGSATQAPDAGSAGASGGGGAGGSAAAQASASADPSEAPPTSSQRPQLSPTKPVDPDLPDDI